MRRTSSSVLAVLSLCVIAALSTPCEAKTIYGCRRTDGLLRIVGGPHWCKTGERLITWESVAPQRYRFAGVTGATYSTADTSYEGLMRACYDEFPNGKLATTEEYKARINPGEITEVAAVAPTPPITNVYEICFDAAGVAYSSITTGAGLILCRPEAPGTYIVPPSVTGQTRTRIVGYPAVILLSQFPTMVHVACSVPE